MNGGQELNRRRQPFQESISIYNNIIGLRWLRKCFKSRGSCVYLGLGSWAGIGLSKLKSTEGRLSAHRNYFGVARHSGAVLGRADEASLGLRVSLTFLTCAGRRSAHFKMASSAGHRDCPHNVRLYSTLGGTCA